MTCEQDENYMVETLMQGIEEMEMEKGRDRDVYCYLVAVAELGETILAVPYYFEYCRTLYLSAFYILLGILSEEQERRKLARQFVQDLL